MQLKAQLTDYFFYKKKTMGFEFETGRICHFTKCLDYIDI